VHLDVFRDQSVWRGRLCCLVSKVAYDSVRRCVDWSAITAPRGTPASISVTGERTVAEYRSSRYDLIRQKKRLESIPTNSTDRPCTR